MHIPVTIDVIHLEDSYFCFTASVTDRPAIGVENFGFKHGVVSLAPVYTRSTLLIPRLHDVITATTTETCFIATVIESCNTGTHGCMAFLTSRVTAPARLSTTLTAQSISHSRLSACGCLNYTLRDARDTVLLT